MTGGVQTLGNELRALYQGPLADFVSARQALAKRLKQAGDAREAEVLELRKPSVSAWAVNQLFAREPREMAALLAAGARARTGRRHAAAAGDTARDAIAGVRAAVPRLAALGAELLTANGRAPGDAFLARLRMNLEALALDPTHAAIAARGWLDDDLPRPSFEVMAALQLGAAPLSRRPSEAAPSRPGAAGARSGRSGRAAHRLEEARAGAARKDRERQERIEQLRLELVIAERGAAERAQAAERAAQTLERAEETAARTAREAAEAGQRAADARARADEARRAARDAERALAKARSALERTERE